MTTEKTACKKCQQEILVTTAAANQGCCKPCSKGINIEDVVDGIETGSVLLRATFVAFIFGVIGYFIGAYFHFFLGVSFAVGLGMVGFIYGCFYREINFFIGWIGKLFFSE